MAAGERASPGSARECAGTAQAGDRQTAVGRRDAALSRGEISPSGNGGRQRRCMSVAGDPLRSWRGVLLAVITVFFLVAAFAVPALPQPLSYHAFADCRTFYGLPNFWNVVSNVPFLVAGALGLASIWRGGGAFVEGREQLPYLVFFLGALLTCAGSSYYHAAPDNTRLVWDRLPMTLGFAGLVAASVA